MEGRSVLPDNAGIIWQLINGQLSLMLVTHCPLHAKNTRPCYAGLLKLHLECKTQKQRQKMKLVHHIAATPHIGTFLSVPASVIDTHFSAALNK